LSKLKFGVFLPFYAFQTKTPSEHFRLIRDTTIECERLGYHSVWLDDHLMFNEWPILECWTTLSALSSLTSKIRLGTMVSCTSHRNPALLAKMAATFDVFSGGRLELGIGAGTQETEHVSYGFGFSKPSIRVSYLVESLEIIKQLWTKKKSNYVGKNFLTKDAVCEPKPLQKPNPPITVGGSGELLMRRATAPYADRFDWGFLPEIEEYKRKLEVLKKQCKKIGRNFDEIEKSCWPGGQVIIAENQEKLSDKIYQQKPANICLEDFKKSTLIGTPEECVDRLQVYADLGVTYFMLFFGNLPMEKGLKLFAESVMDKLL
jgi:alkanesulfonate monooxygenase SsuD/methylene tetrahydromethanopterin reductase-like flavin-dependent oxidoreductase (luciferase family)